MSPVCATKLHVSGSEVGQTWPTVRLNLAKAQLHVTVVTDAHMKAALPSSKLCPLVPVPDLPQRHMMRPHLLTK